MRKDLRDDEITSYMLTAVGWIIAPSNEQQMQILTLSLILMWMLKQTISWEQQQQQQQLVVLINVKESYTFK